MTTTFDILRRPLVTEKTNYQVTNYTSMSSKWTEDATRTQVKDAVETIFKVTSFASISSIRPENASRRAKSRRLMLRTSGIKKAIVTLSPENRIPIFEGVE